MEEILTGALGMFLPKEPSRNSLNNKRELGYFSEHYRHIFACRLPHRDTVFDIPSEPDNGEPERVKMNLMSKPFEQKHLREYRLLDGYYPVAVDATGVFGFDQCHCPHCLTRKSKNGKITYFHYVPEAKPVTEDGHAFSLCGEWIENPEGEFNKRDCERKAFLRLAAKLKKQYPRLPVCIPADGPYPYGGAFRTCEDKGWKYIFVLRENSLKSIREEPVPTRRRKPPVEYYHVKEGRRISEEYHCPGEAACAGR